MATRIPHRRVFSTLVAVATLAMLAGCVRSRVTPFDAALETEPRTPPDQIKFYGEQRPRCGYKEIGTISAESRFLAPWSSVVRTAREKAYEMGGDAIIGVNQRTRISGVTVSENGGSTTETTSLSGIVVRFTRIDCRE